MERTKIYFASDFHFGVPDRASSLLREEKFINWLDEVRKDAKEIYILGDLFDFWFEYQTVIPKGYVRLLAKLAQIQDDGIPIHFFKGNHDLWMFGYFENELGIKVYHEPIIKEWNGKRFFIGHGDGLGPGDYGYKFLKLFFTNPICQFLFNWIHPDIGVRLALWWSSKSRYQNEKRKMDEYKGHENEYLYQYCKKRLEKEHFDYFILGHRHLALNIALNNKSNYVNLGDWINLYTYAVYDGNTVELKEYAV